MTTPNQSGKTSAKAIVLFITASLIFSVLAAEGFLRLTMTNWREFNSGRFMRTIHVPGHGMVATGQPGFEGHFAQNDGDFRVRVKVNDFGLRNPEQVEAAAIRIWFVGDSYAFGWGVEHDEIFSSVAGKLLKAPVYNVASPGTNVCGYQALVARTTARAQSRAVVIGLTLENDILPYDCRKKAAEIDAARGQSSAEEIPPKSSASVKRFLTEHTALYNFFAVILKRVALIREFLTAVGLIAEGHEYRRTVTEATLDHSVDRTAAEIDALRDRLPDVIPFAVLMVPGRFEVQDGDPFYRKLREKMGAALAGRGIAVIDPFEGFRKEGFQSTHFAHDGHWTPLGHEIAGHAAAAWLGAQGIGN